MFKDENTKLPVEGAPPNRPDAVHLDAMGFGMGCCCLQLTFQVSLLQCHNSYAFACNAHTYQLLFQKKNPHFSQACNITEARILYDQLTPLCPIMLALSAASPVYRGYLTESDCRWNVISASVDCRTAEERGEIPLDKNQFHINKSRYDSIDSYLSPAGEQ